MSKLEKAEKWATIIGAVVAIFGLWWLIQSIRNDAEATRIQQRAWVGVSQVELDREPVDGETIAVRVTVVNEGASPATDVISKSNLSILAAPPYDNWDLLKDAPRSLILPDAAGAGVNKSLVVSPGTTAAYRAGHLRIWVTGRINYSDAFGKPHWTTFCFSHAPNQNLQLFSMCETGNEMDREAR